VRAGQPLIRLDGRDFRAAVDRADAIVAARQATLDSLKRKRSLQTAIRQEQADLDAKTAQAALAKQEDQGCQGRSVGSDRGVAPH
jgi:membrane fusion protein (multidrug efflux system)